MPGVAAARGGASTALPDWESGARAKRLGLIWQRFEPLLEVLCGDQSHKDRVARDVDFGHRCGATCRWRHCVRVERRAHGAHVPARERRCKESSGNALPEPEASKRAEEWAAQIADLASEPIAAFLHAKRLRRDAVQMVGELNAIAEGHGGEVSSGLRWTRRRRQPRLIPRFRALVATGIERTSSSRRLLKSLLGRILPRTWLDAIRQVLLFALAYVGYRLVGGNISLFIEPSVDAWAAAVKLASNSVVLSCVGLVLVAYTVWRWRRMR